MPSRWKPNLLTLPAELRNAIFSLVLPEPSSCITLRREKPLPLKFKAFAIKADDRVGNKEPFQTICVALLRTCKQTNRECTELLRWNQHKFIFDSVPLSKYIRQLVGSRFPALPFRYIRDLEVQFEPFSVDTGLGECLGRLGKWAEQGILKSLTLKAFFNQETHPYHFQSGATNLQWAYDQLRKALTTTEGNRTGATLPDGLQQIERSLILTTKAAKFMLSGSTPPIKVAYLCMNLHNIFGGELWVGEKLIYKDGKKMLGDLSN